MDILLLTLILSVGINIIIFVPAYIYKTDKLTDISYAITFAALAIYGFVNSDQNRLDLIILCLVLLWSLRIGSFLYIRINKAGKDHRFDGMREHFFPFLRFWLLQGVTVFIVMLSALLGYNQLNENINALSIIGVFVFLAGLTLEGVADAQKYRFSNHPRNKGVWIDKGVWRSSRHPNYLGEMMVWSGMYMVVVPSLSGWSIVTALLSPLYIICLLLFVSGIPLLEKSADKKWGDDKKYKQYKQEVPVLIPTPKSLQRAIK